MDAMLKAVKSIEMDGLLWGASKLVPVGRFILINCCRSTIYSFGPQVSGDVSPVFRIHINLIRIRIQHFRLNTDPVPDPIRIQGFDKQIYTAEKKSNYNLPIPRLSYRRSL
jgi:hypothetical protein